MLFRTVLLLLLLIGGTAPAAAASVSGLKIGAENSFIRLADLSIDTATVEREDLPPQWAGEAYIAARIESFWLFAGVYSVDRGYVIYAPGTEAYWPLTFDLETRLRERGLLTGPLPVYRVPIADYVFGYSLWPFVLIIGVFAGYRRYRDRLERARLMERLGGTPEGIIRQTLITAALADGEVEAVEVEQMVTILSELSQQPVSIAQMRRAVEANTMSREELYDAFIVLSGALDEGLKWMILQALCMMFAADGHVAKAEHRMLVDYGAALGFSPDELESLLPTGKIG